MKLVLDTKVLIAAFISRGHSHELLEHVARTHEVFTADFILAELRDKLATRFRMPESTVDDMQSLLRSRLQVVAPAALPARVS